jgi:hypothetical protein
VKPEPHGDEARALFRKARWAGAVLLVITALLVAVLPSEAGHLAPGLRSPILAFELAKSHAEIEALFGDAGSPDRARFVGQMDLGNQIDFAFMVAYASLLSLVAAGIALVAGRRYFLAAVLAPLAALADVLENLQLFTITASLGGNYDEALARLAVFTWLKWGGLAFALAWLSPALLRGRLVERVVGVVALVTGLLAIGATIDRTHFAQVFAGSIQLAFVGIWIVAFRNSSRSTL